MSLPVEYVHLLESSGSAATWTADNPVLLLAERGYETDTGKEKIGDGVTSWNSLAYLTSTDPAFLDFTSPQWGGAVGSDWSPAIANLLASAGSSPFILTAPSLISGSTYHISQNHAFLPGQIVQGAGGGQIFSSVGGLVFTCSTSAAGLTISAVGGLYCGFRVDANGVGHNPLVIGTQANPGDGGTFIDVSAINAAQINFSVIYSQNHSFICCAANNATLDNLFITGGAGGHSFYRFEGAGAERYNCRIDASSATYSGVQYPLYCNFNHCFFEHEISTAGVSELYVANGGSGGTGPEIIRFDDCNFVGAAANSGPTIDILGNSQGIVFNDPSITCSTVGGFRIADTSTAIVRDPVFIAAVGGSAGAFLLQSTSASINVTGQTRLNGTFTATYGGSQGANAGFIVSYQTITPIYMARGALSDIAMEVTVTANAGKVSYADFANGLRYYYNSSDAPDTYIGPSSVIGGGAPNGGGMTTNKGMGFWGTVAPASQPAAITTPSGGTIVDVQARAAIDAILAVLSAGSGGNGTTA